MSTNLFSVYEVCLGWSRESEFPCWAQLETDSTNDEAKRQGISAVDKARLYLADQQSSGRGRNANVWENARPGSCLLSSWAFRLSSPAQHITGPLLGLAVYEAMEITWPSSQWALKAPNDILLNGKKVAGLLTEALSQGDQNLLVVGLGINVFDKPKKIENAGFLAEEIHLNEDGFLTFLSHLERKFHGTRHECQKLRMDPEQVERLTRALSRNPNLEKLIKGVSATGDIIFDDQRISWQEI